MTNDIVVSNGHIRMTSSQQMTLTMDIANEAELNEKFLDISIMFVLSSEQLQHV